MYTIDSIVFWRYQTDSPTVELDVKPTKRGKISGVKLEPPVAEEATCLHKFGVDIPK